MMTSKYRFLLFSLASVIGCYPATGGLAAQQSAPNCTQASSITTRGELQAGYREALLALPNCGDQGVRALANLWNRPPGDTTHLATLAGVSAITRDSRLFEAVQIVVKDKTQPEDARLAGLRTLVAYYDPSIGLMYRMPLQPTPLGSSYVLIGKSDHRQTVREGPQALSADVRQEVLTLLNELGSGDSTQRITKIARYLGEQLSSGRY